jgi:hypothetical protein
MKDNKKIFIANKDCEEHNIQKGDRVEMVSALAIKFEVLNLRTNEYIKLSTVEFINIFK